MTLDIEYIKSVIGRILEQQFSEGERRRVISSDNELSFCCPICGDSARDNKKKRGHLYFNTMRFRCYNENCRGTFTSLAKRFNITLDAEQKLNILAYIEANTIYNSVKSDEYVLSSLDKLIPIQDLQDYFDSGTGFLSSFRPVQKGDKVFTYLKKRAFSDEFIINNIYCAVQHITGSWKEPVMVFLNRTKDKILGLQIRNLKDDKRYRRFKIYNFETLYSSIYNEPLDEIEAASYNKLSYLFGILNVNFENTVTIFEGYLDSKFFPNAIGAVGTNTDFSFLMQNDLPIRFFFDNDITGQKKAFEYMSKGYSVFLWNKLIEDCSKRNGDYHENKTILSQIKDLNKLAMAITNPYKSLNLENYFSKDILDKLWLPVYKFEKRDFKKEQRISDIHNKMANNQWDALKEIIRSNS